MDLKLHARVILFNNVNLLCMCIITLLWLATTTTYIHKCYIVAVPLTQIFTRPRVMILAVIRIMGFFLQTQLKVEYS